MIRVKIPATTTNLGPASDCLGMALELYNVVEMVAVNRGLNIEVQGEGMQEIPRDESNIVFCAARRIFEKVGYDPGGLKIRLINRIPVARGLGSSAAAIVGGLVAGNVLVGNKLSKQEILNIAAEIEGHPDNVASALFGGIVVSVKVNGSVKYIKIDAPPSLKCVVVVPEFSLSTETAREILPQQVSLHDAVYNISRAAMLVAALMKGDYDVLNTAMEDRLHQPVRSSLVPGMKKVIAAAKLAGARGVTLSGAGPALVAFADANYNLIARVMRETFWQSGVVAKALILRPTPVGARALHSR